jgi:hypothetical protein
MANEDLSATHGGGDETSHLGAGATVVETSCLHDRGAGVGCGSGGCGLDEATPEKIVSTKIPDGRSLSTGALLDQQHLCWLSHPNRLRNEAITILAIMALALAVIIGANS